MIGTTKDDVDPEKMTSAELHAHFTRLLVGRAQDMDTCLGDVDSKLSDAMDKIAGIEASFKFQEVMARLPPQPQDVDTRLGVHKMWTHAWVMLIPSSMPSSRKSWPVYHHSHSRASTHHMLAAFLSYRHLRVPLQLRHLLRTLWRRPPRMDMLLTRGKTSSKMKQA
jgi:hypothetical protein